MSANETLPSRRLPSVSIPKAGKTVRLQANSTELQQIVAHLDLASCEQMSADLTLVPGRGDTIHVTGSVKSSLHQTCVITLEPFAVSIDEIVDVRFAPPEKLGPISKAEVERTLEDEDPPEPLDNGSIDVWALAIDHIAVALDPYPRKPGAELPSETATPTKENPFAALLALKKGLEKS
jgi:uncharacterized metal-binding protein YceD (DUF177 family)